MDEDHPIFMSGYRPTPVNYSECKKESPQFWQYIRSELLSEDISTYDLASLNLLCSNSNWMDLLPKGLVSSYSYLYHCVKGLGCEDAEAIEKDVLRTVGAVKDGPKVFGDTSDNGKAGLARSMHRVLTSISIIDSMGYCQGMNYIVDFLLKMKSEEETFSLFLFALRNKHLCSLYETKLPVLSEFMEIFELHLAHRLPVLSHHLKERGFIAPFYSIEWFTTLFTLASPFDLTVAIWDMFYAGIQVPAPLPTPHTPPRLRSSPSLPQDTQLRCGLAIMEVLEPLLLKMSTEELLKEFRYLCQTVTRDDVILRALRIQLTPVRVGLESNHPRLIDPKYKEEKFTDTLLWLRAQYLSEAKTAMQERDIDNARWVKQRKSEKYEKRKQKYLRKRKKLQTISNSTAAQVKGLAATGAEAGEEKDLTPLSEDCRLRNISCESDGPYSAMMAGSDQERSSEQSSTRETIYSGAFAPVDSAFPPTAAPRQRSFSFPDQSNDSDLLTQQAAMAKVGEGPLGANGSGAKSDPPDPDQKQDPDSSPTIDSPRAPLESMNSFMSNESELLRRQDSEEEDDRSYGYGYGGDRDDMDDENDEEEQEEELATPYEVYFEFFVSPTLLLFANLLKTIILKCDRITSWNLLNQIWLETLPHIKNNLAKYNFADYMLRYSIQSNAHLRVIQFFLCVGGSDPNSQDRWLRTPLHYAVVYNRPDILRFLLLIGADSTVPGAICISSIPSSWNGSSSSSTAAAPASHSSSSSSQVNYNLYTPKELLLHLNISSSAPSLMLLKERCCLWCQKLFQSADKASSSHHHNSSGSGNGNSTSYVRAYCGLCTIPFCVQCIQYHKCVYSIDKYEYHKNYLQQYLRQHSSSLSTPASTASPESKPENLSAEIKTEKGEGQSGDQADEEDEGSQSQQENEEGKERHVTSPDSDDEDGSVLSAVDERGEGDDEGVNEGKGSVRIHNSQKGPSPPVTSSPHFPDDLEDDLLDSVIIRIDTEEQANPSLPSVSILEANITLQSLPTVPLLPLPPLSISASVPPLEFHFSDDQSEAMNGRDSVDSGFGSADEVDLINSSGTGTGVGDGARDLKDDIEEYEDSENEIVVSDSDDDEHQPVHSYDPISLVRPFKNFLGKKRSSSKVTHPTPPHSKEESVVVSEETDLSTLSSSNSSKPSGLLLPWRRNSQLHVEVGTGDGGGVSPRQESKSVFSRTLSLDLGILTGDKKESSKTTSQLTLDSPLPSSAAASSSGEQFGTPNHLSGDNTHNPHTEKTKTPSTSKKRGGMLSISDSLRKLTKGIGRGSITAASAPANTAYPAESVTSYLCNDEPVSKFTADGIPLYWVGYQETQFIALQPWQILLLPIVYQTERYYDSALVPPLSPFHGLQDPTPAPTPAPPETMLSPASALSSQQRMFPEDDDLLESQQPSPRQQLPTSSLSASSTCLPTDSFAGFTAELEQNQPKYLYFKYDIAGYYSLLIKDTELLTIDLHSNHSPRTAEASHTDTTAAGAEAAADDSEDTYRSPSDDEYHFPSVPSTHFPVPSSSSRLTHSSGDTTEVIFSKHTKILRHLQSSSWSLHEGDSQWAPNDCAWYCRTCYSAFSLFQRKHHCRRCGEVFCDDHAPKVELVSCLPNHFREVLVCIPSSELPDKKQLRLCVTCQHEMRECKSLFNEYQSLAPMYTFEFWLETLSKSIRSSAPSAAYRGDNGQEDQSSDGRAVTSPPSLSTPLSSLLAAASLTRGSTQERGHRDHEDHLPVNNRSFKASEVGLWMDTMADWIWRDRHHPQPSATSSTTGHSSAHSAARL